MKINAEKTSCFLFLVLLGFANAAFGETGSTGATNSPPQLDTNAAVAI
jgi:hypothetical protein